MNFYTIMYNVTKVPNGFAMPLYIPYPSDKKLTKLKTLIDNAYLSYYSSLNNMTIPSISNRLQAYPTTPTRFSQGANVISLLGVFYLFFPPVIIFSIIMGDLVKEKENNLKKYLNLYGLSYPGYWTSWILLAILASATLSLEIIFFGRFIFRYEFFVNTNSLVIFSLFFLFTLNMQIFAMFLSCILNDSKSATTVNIY